MLPSYRNQSIDLTDFFMSAILARNGLIKIDIKVLMVLLFRLFLSRLTYSKCHKIKFVMLKKPSYQFFSYLITSENIGISSQNFLTFKFNLSATLVLNFKAIPSEPKTPLKKWFFWSKLRLS